MVKVALCGKMASGKTTIAENFISDYSFFQRVSLADAVKRFARFIFDIPEGHKDRVAFQKMGDGARRFLYEDVWIDVLLKEVEFEETHGNMEHFVIDDVRYKNEVIKLKENGWLVIKIDIHDDLQIERLKNAYPENWQTHVDARNHASDAEMDDIPDRLFDLVIKAEDSKSPFRVIEDFASASEITTDDNKPPYHQRLQYLEN